MARRVMRPVFVSLLYLISLLAFHWVTAARGFSQAEPWRLSVGLGFGFLVVFGFQFLPLVFGGQFIMALWQDPSAVAVPQGLIVAGAMSSTYVLGAFALRRGLSGRSPDLQSTLDVRLFLLMVPFVAAFSSAGTVANWWFDGIVRGEALRSALVGEAAANMAGLLLITPICLLFLSGWVERALNLLTGEAIPVVTRVPEKIRAVVIVAAIGGILSSVFLFAISDRFELFCLLSVPLILSALKYGTSGVAVMFAIFGVLASWLGWHQGARTLEIHVVVSVACVNVLILGSVLNQRLKAERAIRRQESFLTSMGVATEQLLSSENEDQNVMTVLKNLAGDIDATRTFLLEVRSDVASSSQPLYQYWKVEPPVDPERREFVNLALRRHIAENATRLSKGEMVQWRTQDHAPDDRALLSGLNVVATLIVPIFVEDRWWGCLGVDLATEVVSWPDAEVVALKTTGRVLAALLSHTNVEQQFKQLTGNIPAVFWIAAPDGLEKTYVSPAYEQIWGWPYESIKNNSTSWIASVYHEDYARVSDAIPKQLLGEYDEEYRIVRSDRSVRWIRETAFPVRDTSGSIDRIVGIAQDITRQKEAEEGLKATSLLLSSLIDNLRAGIVVEDQSRQIIHVNQAFCRMFGMQDSTEALVGSDSRQIFADQPVWAKRTDEIILEGLECRAEEMASGAGRVFLRDYFPLSVDGDCQYHLWRYEDITDRKRSEEKIRSSLKEKEVLLKEIHHRVKNNLQVISSLLNLQANQIRDRESAQVFRDSQSRVRAMSLVHERLYQSSDLARIDFAGYVTDVTRHLLRSYQSRSQAVRLDVNVEPISLNIDTAIPCALIINELVSNSLKYAFPDGRNGEIKIRLNQLADNDLRLVISDNGIGFPDDVSWEKTNSLGLQLVRSLTDQLNGSIQCQLAHGAEFDIRFKPVVAESRN